MNQHLHALFYFLLIGNKTFIQKIEQVHDGEHSDQEKIHQKLNLIECKNAEMEIQFVKPQTRAHGNKVLKRRAFKRSKSPSLSSKMRVRSKLSK